MRVLSALACALLLTLPLAAADIDGKWEASIQGRMGMQQTTFTLKAEGSSLTGTVAGGRGGESPIQDGKVEGAKISFKQELSFGDRHITFVYSGTLSGDEIAMTRKVEGGPGGGREQSFTAKRAN